MQDFYRSKTVAVTGAAGSIGKELVKMLLDTPARYVIGLDNNEGELFALAERFSDDKRLQAFLCDVGSFEDLRTFFTGVDYVFHAAAFKNVPVCERNPSLAVRTNILGTDNIIAAARATGVRRVLFTSSDKAVNPTNVMGTTKLMGERLVTAANALNQGSGTIFASTRFGNVVGSRGSVIPIFLQQIADGKPITLTDQRMTRFMMSLADASRLVLQSMVMACGGEVFVTKMPAFSIGDLAEVVIDYAAPRFGRSPADTRIVEIGSRTGEKLYEELVTEEEITRAYEIGDLIVVLPAFRNIYNDIDYGRHIVHGVRLSKPYRSANEMLVDKEGILLFLQAVENMDELFDQVIPSHEPIRQQDERRAGAAE